MLAFLISSAFYASSLNSSLNPNEEYIKNKLFKSSEFLKHLMAILIFPINNPASPTLFLI